VQIWKIFLARYYSICAENMHDQIKCTRIEVLVNLGVTKWNSNKICHDVNFEKLRMFWK
jgi:hypothetical protein